MKGKAEGDIMLQASPNVADQEAGQAEKLRPLERGYVIQARFRK